MARVLSKRHHYGFQDQAKLEQAIDLILEAGPLPDAYFCADNLITYFRNLSFLSDARLVDSINAEKPSGRETSLMWRTHVVTWAAQQCLAHAGDFVEGGTYRGFTARVVCNYLKFGALDRTYWLYDRFDRNPERETQLSGLGGEKGDTLYQDVVQRFADLPNVKIIRGSVPDSFAQGMPERVAFLHLDMNSVIGEIGMLDALFERMSPGGIILLDDYGWYGYRDQQRAEQAWFAERGRQVLELPTGQGMVIR